MVYGKLLSEGERINEVNDILNEVFIKEMNYKNNDIFDITGKQAIHALLYEGLNEEKAVATGRLDIINDKAYIKWVGVRKEYRNKLYGDTVVRMLTDKAKSMSIKEIYAEVPANLIGMFKNIGFDIYNNEEKSTNEKGYFIMKYGNRGLSCCKN